MDKRELQEKLITLKSEYKNAINGLPMAENLLPSQQVKAHCPKHGEFTKYVRKVDLIGKSFETRCPNCIKEVIELVEQQIRDLNNGERQAKIKELKDKSGIPLRFASANFDSYIETTQNRLAKKICQRYADKWLERFKLGGGLVFCGKPGTGKNHLACAIANSVIENHQSEVYLTTVMRIIRKVKSTWGKDSDLTEEDAIKFYCGKSLLIIDELGVQFGTESEKIILFEIINERYEQMRPTILISNLTEEELGKYIGDRIIDRMKEGQGAVIKFDWESYRK